MRLAMVSGVRPIEGNSQRRPGPRDTFPAWQGTEAPGGVLGRSMWPPRLGKYLALEMQVTRVAFFFFGEIELLIFRDRPTLYQSDCTILCFDQHVRDPSTPTSCQPLCCGL